MRSSFAGPSSSQGKYKATLDPGKSVASSANGSPAEFYSKSQKDVIQDVTKGTQLKPTNTVDKSKPLIDASVHVKKVDRKPFLQEVTKDHELHHVEEPADRSEPSILSILADVHVKQNDRKGFLAEVEVAAKEKGTAVDDE